MISLEHQKIEFESLEAVIFDVDGTLYNQKRLRLIIFFSLLRAVCFHSGAWAIVKVLRSFRRYRESAANIDAEASLESQYDWVAGNTNLKRAFVREVVETWMFAQPLKHLGGCQYAGIDSLFKKLKERNIRIGVFSDYPAKKKLSAMSLEADCYVCSTDNDVRRLKPSPEGLLKCCEKMQVDPMNALFIGDRDDLDGACARGADIPYLIVPKGGGASGRFYNHLTKKFRSI